MEHRRQESNILKYGRHLFALSALRYQFIEEYREENPIYVLCDMLEVLVSGYFAWMKRPMSQHSREDGLLVDHMQSAYHANRQISGSPRLQAELRAQGDQDLTETSSTWTVRLPSPSSDDDTQ